MMRIDCRSLEVGSEKNLIFPPFLIKFDIFKSMRICVKILYFLDSWFLLKFINHVAFQYLLHFCHFWFNLIFLVYYFNEFLLMIRLDCRSLEVGNEKNLKFPPFMIKFDTFKSTRIFIKI